MHIKIGLARRPGGATRIYSEPLKHGDVLVDPSGGFTPMIEATGMKDAKSRYRYRIYLTRGEAETQSDRHSVTQPFRDGFDQAADEAYCPRAEQSENNKRSAIFVSRLAVR